MTTGILDYDLVRTLVTISETGSFTATGQRLGLTQQAISAQIKRLEAMVGRRLTARRGQKSYLTADGTALVAYAREAMMVEERVRRHFATVSLAGRIRLGLVEGFASTVLPAVLATLRRQQPDLEMVAETGRTEQLLEQMGSGGIDIVLGAQHPGQNLGDALFVDKLRWIGDSHLLNDPSAPLRIVTLPDPSLVRSIMIDALAKAGRPFTIVFESASRNSRHAAIVAGLGVGVSCAAFEDVAQPVLNSDLGLPPLDRIEFFMRVNGASSELIRDVAGLLRDAIIDSLRNSHVITDAR